MAEGHSGVSKASIPIDLMGCSGRMGVYSYARLREGHGLRCRAEVGWLPPLDEVAGLSTLGRRGARRVDCGH